MLMKGKCKPYSILPKEETNDLTLQIFRYRPSHSYHLMKTCYYFCSTTSYPSQAYVL